MQTALAAEPQRPRRLYQAGWMFEVGAAVRSGDMAAIVLGRSRTARGREIYRLWVMGSAHGRPFRSMMGSALS